MSTYPYAYCMPTAHSRALDLGTVDVARNSAGNRQLTAVQSDCSLSWQ